MEKEHRRIILDNIGELIKFTNYKQLMKRCLDRKIMFPIMETEIEVSSSIMQLKLYYSQLTYVISMQKLQVGNETKHKLLFEKLTRRGPNAFQGLVEICKSDFIEAANLLQRRSARFIPLYPDLDDKDVSIKQKRNDDKKERKERKNNRDKNNAGIAKPLPDIDITDKSVSRSDIEQPLQLELFTKEVAPSKLAIKVIKSKKFHTHKTLDTYDMRSRHRGVFFLVNIINFHRKDPRNGASVDRDNLITLFRGMEFEIFYYEDITSLVSTLRS